MTHRARSLVPVEIGARANPAEKRENVRAAAVRHHEKRKQLEAERGSELRP